MPNPARLSRLAAGPRRRLPKIALVAVSLALGGALVTVQAASAQPTSTMAAPNHVFLIKEENNGFSDVIGNPAAPNLNYLADTFGLETNYFGVSQFSSEPNYVGLLGGSQFSNVVSDDAYWKNTVDGPSLISQMDQAGVSWKAAYRPCHTRTTRASATPRSATAHRTVTPCMCPSTTASRTSPRRGIRMTGRSRCRSGSCLATCRAGMCRSSATSFRTSATTCTAIRRTASIAATSLIRRTSIWSQSVCPAFG
jgi:hypothetical protein